MGTYLSTPVTEKGEESGESLECPEVPCAWGVVDMQGWRKSMEDAHLAVTDIPLPGVDDSPTKPDAKVFGVFDGHGGPEVARFSALYLVSVLTQQPTWNEGIVDAPVAREGEAGASLVGQALRSAFHALDRMIHDQDRREEIITLRNLKPSTGERREALSIPKTEDTPSKSTTSSESPTEGAQPPTPTKSATENNLDGDSETNSSTEGNSGSSNDKKSESETRESTADDEKDDDSNEAVGKEEAAELDRDMMDDDNDVKAESEAVDPSNTERVTSMFQKFLSLGGGQGSSGQVAVKVDEAGSGQDDPAPSPPAQPMGPSASQPTIVQNGRMICNLPDHPIHAGATAIVAVITGRTLTVANAGDSRAVLCRKGGETLALSFDHKPQQDREMTRITNAGGFVNHFGRVNGNLNLSRSIGDLKYKQVPGVPPEAQIITAEPDIVQLKLEPDDEFIILGCDGIWDCLTNENAVKYVRERIDEKLPTEIGREMLDTIISEDPRVTQGIGGDNMTIMVIDLQPSTRKVRQSKSEEAASEPSEPAPAE